MSANLNNSLVSALSHGQIAIPILAPERIECLSIIMGSFKELIMRWATMLAPLTDVKCFNVIANSSPPNLAKTSLPRKQPLILLTTSIRS